MPIRSSRAGSSTQGWLRCVLAALLLVTAGGAEACPICLSGLVVTPGQQLDGADQVVLAVPAAGENRFRIVEVVKGNDIAGGTIVEETIRVDAEALRNGKPLVLLRNALAQRWSSIGAIGREHAGWLRSLTANGNPGRSRPKASWPQTMQTSSEPTDAEWRDRVALVLPHLESLEPLAADIAYGEISRASYAAMRSLKPRLDAAKIASWIDDPKLAARRSTYTLLLGIAGGPDDAARLERRIEAAWQARDATNLAAMLAADLELRGPSRVGWIEKMYFADRDRGMPEIEAALLALSVHGGADAAVSRQRVIQAYRLFIRERKPMAGFVAQELADWEYWDATSDYVTLLKTDAVKDPASHFAVVNYLRRSPHATAKAALRSLADQPR
jgi:hypothetical protein